MKFLKNLGLVLLLALVLAAWVMLPWFGALALAVLLALWMLLTRRGAQARSVTSVGVSTLPQRLGSSAVIVVGIAGVVGVLVALLAMAEGYAETLRKSGSEDTAIVLRGASAAEVASVMSREDITQIAQAPGVAKSAKGEPLVSAETWSRPTCRSRARPPTRKAACRCAAWAMKPSRCGRRSRSSAGASSSPGSRS
ncbi:hypothetical protein [Mitsuaria sp. TWR114]|uniref:hypothetical protein n=1 Tax=Mitsuaria sp. TWR114 TaxID=2601731 RepID=UPI0021032B1F|nr:hypothetical protein [Mitsuaria sp. TWR114]